ncbi:MAG: type II secretion system F family protein [Halanaerobiaceae bacterium]
MASTFEYTAKNKNGDSIKGILEADTPTQIVKTMEEKGFFVVSLKEQNKAKKELFSPRVKTSDLAVFSQQFATLIEAGINLIDSLEILREQVNNKKLAEVIGIVHKDVESGTNLSEAMARHPHIFPNLFSEMIRTGETGGVLDRVLLQLADYFERQDEINGKVKSGMYYPAVILVIAIGVIFFLMVGVVPRFIEVFNTLGGVLPVPTRLLLAISSFVRNFWWAIILFFLSLVYGFNYYRKTKTGGELIDNLILKMPVLKNLLQKIYLSRISSTLAILLESGIDLLTSLEIIENIVGNTVYTRILNNSREQVREGVRFSSTINHNQFFPNMMVQMLKVGEESGNLEKMLKKISLYYDREVKIAINGSISLIEPALIILLAVVVGFIVISIILPMFDIYQYI